ncbi:telomeric repeat-binding factor 2-like, partial [Bombina bombina]
STFDKDGNESPLESAIGILDVIQNELQLDAELVKSNKLMLKEAAVVVCIKKKQYERASRILQKLFSNHTSTRKLHADLKEIIKERNLKHPIVRRFSFSTIKQKIYKLFESLIDDAAPFLLT